MAPSPGARTSRRLSDRREVHLLSPTPGAPADRSAKRHRESVVVCTREGPSAVGRSPPPPAARTKARTLSYCPACAWRSRPRTRRRAYPRVVARHGVPPPSTGRNHGRPSPSFPQGWLTALRAGVAAAFPRSAGVPTRTTRDDKLPNLDAPAGQSPRRPGRRVSQRPGPSIAPCVGPSGHSHGVVIEGRISPCGPQPPPAMRETGP
jgi:hypothetical protein